ncbi:hypothetical protein B0J17DRAFT_670897 [Rhizoctonia solani]|nr:hypothetical protein B0J17DRAFT_670897 [Rhizoctonia solani]
MPLNYTVQRGATLPVVSTGIPSPYMPTPRRDYLHPTTSIGISICIIVGWLWYIVPGYIVYLLSPPGIVPLLFGVLLIVAISGSSRLTWFTIVLPLAIAFLGYALQYHQQLRACFSHR